MAQRFEIPKTIITGRGAHRELKNLPELLGKKRALIFTDESRIDQEVIEKCNSPLPPASK